MFTGIIEEVGTIKQIQKNPASAVLTIAADTVLEQTKIGDSIAVNGVCLTVTDLKAGSFTADVMHETLRRSSLGSVRTGSPVNLERAMQLGGRFGGHIVSGHIDGTGTITKYTKEENAIWVTIKAPDEILDRCLVQPFVFAGLYIPSGGRMAVSGGLCGIVPVQQSISGNCVFRGVSDDCHAVGTVGGHFFPVFYQRCFCSLSFPAFRAGICHRDPPVLISVLPFAVRDRKCGTACQ